MNTRPPFFSLRSTLSLHHFFSLTMPRSGNPRDANSRSCTYSQWYVLYLWSDLTIEIKCARFYRRAIRLPTVPMARNWRFEEVSVYGNPIQEYRFFFCSFSQQLFLISATLSLRIHTHSLPSRQMMVKPLLQNFLLSFDLFNIMYIHDGCFARKLFHAAARRKEIIPLRCNAME